MEEFFQKVTDNVYGFLLWDESWNSYNNCYILIGENEITLIDSGKEEHFQHLESALKNINLDKKDISKFVATHGHKDHIGGIQSLAGIEGSIHRKDLDLLPTNLGNKLSPNLPDGGSTVSSLECVLLGHHTKGSVALYHHESGVLFCGDHLCFFGEPLPDKMVVDKGELVREKFKKFVSDWSQSEEMRKEHNFDLFIEGLKDIRKFNAEYLCTGHGVVLKGNISGFISDLLDLE